MSNSGTASAQSDGVSIKNEHLYEALVSAALKEDANQRSISRNKKGIYHVHEIAFVYEYEKTLHAMLPQFDGNYASSARESTTDHVEKADLVLRRGDQNVVFEFKMDCALNAVAHDALKLAPAVKAGDAAFLINIKSMGTNELPGFTKNQTAELNKSIRTITGRECYAENVVSEFDFISQAGKPKLADVICMWQVRA